MIGGLTNVCRRHHYLDHSESRIVRSRHLSWEQRFTGPLVESMTQSRTFPAAGGRMILDGNHVTPWEILFLIQVTIF